MKIAVIDGMGGGIGAEIVAQLRKKLDGNVSVIALGTNASATERMMQAKASKGATGENAIVISIRNADFIIGPIGIAFPNSIMGEITPRIAEAVSLAPGKKILIPVLQPHYDIIGVGNYSLNEFIDIAAGVIKKEIDRD